MHDYMIVTYYDKEDNIFISYIPDLPGCAAHGATPEQSIKELSIAFDLWIQTAKDVGKEIPLPKVVQYAI